MKTFLLRFFTWWNGQTFGTQLWTALYGELVGEDEFGNRYYRTKGGKIDPTLGFERRWVIYNGVAEASSVPPSWHGWLHHTFDLPPTQEKVVSRPWWRPHRPNLTGTPGAHRPSGSTLAQGRRPRATGDYKAWKPGRYSLIRSQSPLIPAALLRPFPAVFAVLTGGRLGFARVCMGCFPASIGPRMARSLVKIALIAAAVPLGATVAGAQ